MANQMGKRYRCEKCGTEVIVTRAGNGEVRCWGTVSGTVPAGAFLILLQGSARYIRNIFTIIGREMV